MVITPGDYGEKAIPVPIPNTEVKLLIADGTIGFGQSNLNEPSEVPVI